MAGRAGRRRAAALSALAPFARVILGAVALLGLVVLAGRAAAVDGATVREFLRLSDAFQGRLQSSRVLDLPAAARRERGACILSRIDNDHGSEGVRALMGLMTVLSRGAAFDDPTIIAFNRSYGRSYRAAETDCTRLARGA